ncbi:MAG: FAD-dependent oxidoreductase [Bradyrhizobium sp.]
MGAPQQILGDIKTFDDPQPIILTRPGLDPNSIAVFDASGTRQLTPGIDYVVRRVGQTIQIDRQIGAAINSGDSVRLNYIIDPLPGYTSTATAVGAGVNYLFDDGWFKGLNVFAHYSQVDQTISPESSGVTPDSVKDLLYGAEYRIWKLTLRAESETRQSTLSPYDAQRFSARYDDRLGDHTTLSLGAAQNYMQYPMDHSKLVLTTGSSALRLNVPGADLAGVHTFRDSRDVDLLLTLAAQKKRVVVVGGGLLGLEAAYGLAKAGAPVTLIHLMDRLMERQLDAPAAALLKSLVERKGIEILLNANTARILGKTHVDGVELVDGRRIDAEAVIFAAGIRPNIALAKDAGIAVNRGIIVDDHLQTGAADIFAIGECAEHRGTCYGLVEPAYEQGRVLAQHLAGREAAYGGSVVATNLKVSGVSVFSAGEFMGGEGSESIVLSDINHGTYKKLVITDGRLTGAVLIGDVGDALWYLELIRTRQPTQRMRADMMFGRSLALRSEAA